MIGAKVDRQCRRVAESEDVVPRSFSGDLLGCADINDRFSVGFVAPVEGPGRYRGCAVSPPGGAGGFGADEEDRAPDRTPGERKYGTRLRMGTQNSAHVGVLTLSGTDTGAEGGPPGTHPDRFGVFAQSAAWPVWGDYARTAAGVRGLA